MSRTTKIVVSIVAALVVIAIAGGVIVWRFLSTGVTTDPIESEAIGQEILPHELPPGFSGLFGTDLFGFRVMAAADTLGTDGMIMLMAMPDGTSEAELRAASRDQFAEQRGGDGRFEYLGTETITIAGRETALDRYVGTENGRPVIQEVALFEAANGNPAMLILIAAEDAYPDAGFERFLKSLE